MSQSVLDHIKGYLQVEYFSADHTRFLNICRNRGVELWGIYQKKQSVFFQCYPKDFKKLIPIRRRCGGTLRISKRRGVIFLLKKNIRHCCYLVGILLFLALGSLLSSRVWKIHFEGNYSYTEEELTKFLKFHEVEYGMQKRNVECEKIELMMREAYPDITWVSAHLQGTKLLIHIKENFDGYTEQTEHTPCNLIANASGVITQMVTRTGVPMVHVGDTVEQGQILVGGIVENYGDQNELLSRNYVQADADIYGEVQIAYEDAFPMEYEVLKHTGNERKFYSLRVLNQSFHITFSKEHYRQSDVTREEHQLKVAEDFYLPVHYGTISVREYEKLKQRYTETEANLLAQNRLDRFLLELQEKGVQILEKNVTIECDSNICKGSGWIRVKQSLGIPGEIQEEETLATPGAE